MGGSLIQNCITVFQSITTPQCQNISFTVLEKVKIHIPMRKLQHHFFGHRIFALIDYITVCKLILKAMEIGMYKQAIPRSGYTHIMTAGRPGFFRFFIGYQQIHVIEFPTFGLVDSRHDHLCP